MVTLRPGNHCGKNDGMEINLQESRVFAQSLTIDGYIAWDVVIPYTGYYTAKMSGRCWMAEAVRYRVCVHQQDCFTPVEADVGGETWATSDVYLLEAGLHSIVVCAESTGWQLDTFVLALCLNRIQTSALDGERTTGFPSEQPSTSHHSEQVPILLGETNEATSPPVHLPAADHIIATPTTLPKQDLSSSETFTPSINPSHVPSFRPHGQSGSPSASPSVRPSLPPTLRTYGQSSSPTANPSARPSQLPSFRPHRLSGSPSARPSQIPSIMLPSTADPTYSITFNPTPRPSHIPSPTPTHAKTIYPTESQTTKPSSRSSEAVAPNHTGRRLGECGNEECAIQFEPMGGGEAGNCGDPASALQFQDAHAHWCGLAIGYTLHLYPHNKCDAEAVDVSTYYFADGLQEDGFIAWNVNVTDAGLHSFAVVVESAIEGSGFQICVRGGACAPSTVAVPMGTGVTSFLKQRIELELASGLQIVEVSTVAPGWRLSKMTIWPLHREACDVACCNQQQQQQGAISISFDTVLTVFNYCSVVGIQVDCYWSLRFYAHLINVYISWNVAVTDEGSYGFLIFYRNPMGGGSIRICLVEGACDAGTTVELDQSDNVVSKEALVVLREGDQTIKLQGDTVTDGFELHEIHVFRQVCGINAQAVPIEISYTPLPLRKLCQKVGVAIVGNFESFRGIESEGYIGWDVLIPVTGTYVIASFLSDSVQGSAFCYCIDHNNCSTSNTLQYSEGAFYTFLDLEAGLQTLQFKTITAGWSLYSVAIWKDDYQYGGSCITQPLYIEGQIWLWSYMYCDKHGVGIDNYQLDYFSEDGYVVWSVDAPRAGRYEFQFHYSNPSGTQSIKICPLDGQCHSESIFLSGTQDFVTSPPHTVWLPEGVQSIKIQSEGWLGRIHHIVIVGRPVITFDESWFHDYRADLHPGSYCDVNGVDVSWYGYMGSAAAGMQEGGLIAWDVNVTDPGLHTVVVVVDSDIVGSGFQICVRDGGCATNTVDVPLGSGVYNYLRQEWIEIQLDSGLQTIEVRTIASGWRLRLMTIWPLERSSCNEGWPRDTRVSLGGVTTLDYSNHCVFVGFWWWTHNTQLLNGFASWNVIVPQAGTYGFFFYYYNPSEGGSIQLCRVGGTCDSNAVSLESDSGNNLWSADYSVSLPEGDQTIKVQASGLSDGFQLLSIHLFRQECGRIDNANSIVIESRSSLPLRNLCQKDGVAIVGVFESFRGIESEGYIGWDVLVPVTGTYVIESTLSGSIPGSSFCYCIDHDNCSTSNTLQYSEGAFTTFLDLEAGLQTLQFKTITPGWGLYSVAIWKDDYQYGVSCITQPLYIEGQIWLWSYMYCDKHGVGIDNYQLVYFLEDGYVVWSVDAPRAGRYEFQFHYSNPSGTQSIKICPLDGQCHSESIFLSGTQDFVTSPPHTVWLPEGVQSIKIQSEGWLGRIYSVIIEGKRSCGFDEAAISFHYDFIYNYYLANLHPGSYCDASGVDVSWHDYMGNAAAGMQEDGLIAWDVNVTDPGLHTVAVVVESDIVGSGFQICVRDGGCATNTVDVPLGSGVYNYLRQEWIEIQLDSGLQTIEVRTIASGWRLRLMTIWPLERSSCNEGWPWDTRVSLGGVTTLDYSNHCVFVGFSWGNHNPLTLLNGFASWNVIVPQAGTYGFFFYYYNPSEGGSIQLCRVGGTCDSNAVSLESDSGNNLWSADYSVSLPEGDQTIKVQASGLSDGFQLLSIHLFRQECGRIDSASSIVVEGSSSLPLRNLCRKEGVAIVGNFESFLGTHDEGYIGWDVLVPLTGSYLIWSDASGSTEGGAFRFCVRLGTCSYKADAFSSGSSPSYYIHLEMGLRTLQMETVLSGWQLKSILIEKLEQVEPSCPTTPLLIDEWTSLTGQNYCNAYGVGRESYINLQYFLEDGYVVWAVDVPRSGPYTFQFEYSNLTGAGSIQICSTELIDFGCVSDTILLPITEMFSVSARHITWLPQGLKSIKIQGVEWFGKLHSVQILGNRQCNYEEAAIGEFHDSPSNGYHVTLSPQSYCDAKGVDVSDFADGVQFDGFIAWNVNVTDAGLHSFAVVVESAIEGSGFQICVRGGACAPSTVAVPMGPGVSSFLKQRIELELASGLQIFEVSTVAPGWRLRKMTIWPLHREACDAAHCNHEQQPQGAISVSFDTVLTVFNYCSVVGVQVDCYWWYRFYAHLVNVYITWNVAVTDEGSYGFMIFYRNPIGGGSIRICHVDGACDAGTSIMLDQSDNVVSKEALVVLREGDQTIKLQGDTVTDGFELHEIHVFRQVCGISAQAVPIEIVNTPLPLRKLCQKVGVAIVGNFESFRGIESEGYIGWDVLVPVTGTYVIASFLSHSVQGSAFCYCIDHDNCSTSNTLQYSEGAFYTFLDLEAGLQTLQFKTITPGWGLYSVAIRKDDDGGSSCITQPLYIEGQIWLWSNMFCDKHGVGIDYYQLDYFSEDGYVVWSVDAPRAGRYEFQFHYSNPSGTQSIKICPLDGQCHSESIFLSGTEDFVTSPPHTVWLPEGVQSIKIQSEGWLGRIYSVIIEGKRSCGFDEAAISFHYDFIYNYYLANLHPGSYCDASGVDVSWHDYMGNAAAGMQEDGLIAWDVNVTDPGLHTVAVVVESDIVGSGFQICVRDGGCATNTVDVPLGSGVYNYLRQEWIEIQLDSGLQTIEVRTIASGWRLRLMTIWPLERSSCNEGWPRDTRVSLGGVTTLDYSNHCVFVGFSWGTHNPLTLLNGFASWNVIVPQAGTYGFFFYYYNPSEGGSIQLCRVGGTCDSNAVSLESDSGNNLWSADYSVSLPEGDQTIKVQASGLSDGFQLLSIHLFRQECGRIDSASSIVVEGSSSLPLRNLCRKEGVAIVGNFESFLGTHDEGYVAWDALVEIPGTYELICHVSGSREGSAFRYCVHNGLCSQDLLLDTSNPKFNSSISVVHGIVLLEAGLQTIRLESLFFGWQLSSISIMKQDDVSSCPSIPLSIDDWVWLTTHDCCEVERVGKLHDRFEFLMEGGYVTWVVDIPRGSTYAFTFYYANPFAAGSIQICSVDGPCYSESLFLEKSDDLQAHVASPEFDVWLPQGRHKIQVIGRGWNGYLQAINVFGNRDCGWEDFAIRFENNNFYGYVAFLHVYRACHMSGMEGYSRNFNFDSVKCIISECYIAWDLIVTDPGLHAVNIYVMDSIEGSAFQLCVSGSHCSPEIVLPDGSGSDTSTQSLFIDLGPGVQRIEVKAVIPGWRLHWIAMWPTPVVPSITPFGTLTSTPSSDLSCGNYENAIRLTDDTIILPSDSCVVSGMAIVREGMSEYTLFNTGATGGYIAWDILVPRTGFYLFRYLVSSPSGGDSFELCRLNGPCYAVMDNISKTETATQASWASHAANLVEGYQAVSLRAVTTGWSLFVMEILPDLQLSAIPSQMPIATPTQIPAQISGSPLSNPSGSPVIESTTDLPFVTVIPSSDPSPRESVTAPTATPVGYQPSTTLSSAPMAVLSKRPTVSPVQSNNSPTHAPPKLVTMPPSSNMPMETPPWNAIGPTTTPQANPSEGPLPIPAGIPTEWPTATQPGPRDIPKDPPTKSPFATVRPSLSAPRAIPSTDPDDQPSVRPWLPPITVPTATSTMAPAHPEQRPTYTPKTVPVLTVPPTPAPPASTKSPLENPPSNEPFRAPTGIPTEWPSASQPGPRDVPNDPPTKSPFATVRPSLIPPRDSPSMNPDDQPSVRPWIPPITVPPETSTSSTPANIPVLTGPPTPAPLVNPTQFPSSTPRSLVPLVVPTMHPTSNPSLKPPLHTASPTAFSPLPDFAFNPSYPPTFREPDGMLPSIDVDGGEAPDETSSPTAFVAIMRTTFGVQVQLVGVELLSEEEVIIWLEISEEWLEDSYNEYLISKNLEVNRDARSIRVKLEFVSQVVTFDQNNFPTNTLTYNEIVTYHTRDAASIASNDSLRRAVFGDEKSMEALVEKLQERIPRMADLKAVQLAPKPTEDTASELSDWGRSLLIVGCAVITLAGVLGYVIYRKRILAVVETDKAFAIHSIQGTNIEPVTET